MSTFMWIKYKYKSACELVYSSEIYGFVEKNANKNHLLVQSTW